MFLGLFFILSVLPVIAMQQPTAEENMRLTWQALPAEALIGINLELYTSTAMINLSDLEREHGLLEKKIQETQLNASTQNSLLTDLAKYQQQIRNTAASIKELLAFHEAASSSWHEKIKNLQKNP